ncbi:MAG: hypothetical protein WC781_03805 [Candidatus Pacearchaeota archaeon]|jgi:prefoldin subunit 5
MQQQEYFLKLQMLEQKANQYGEQLNLINQQIDELIKMRENLIKLEQSKDSEGYSEFGKGIYLKTTIDKKQILVDVGANVLVPKSSSEIREIIEEQIKKFEDIKPEIAAQIEHINRELDKIVQSAQAESKKENNEDKKTDKKKK